MRWEIFLMLGLVLVAGCISGARVCIEGDERCFGEEKQTCQGNQWAKTGECALPVQPSEILENPESFEGTEFQVEGTVTAKTDDSIQIDRKVWVKCISAECQKKEIDEEVKITSTPSYSKIYNITYVLPRTQSYLAERYEIEHNVFPVSSEGAITSDDCNALAENYFVENGVSPTDSTQYSLAYAAFYRGGDATLEAYNRVVETLCVMDEASIVTPYSNESASMWCAKIRGGDYCYFASNDFRREKWDWEMGAYEGVDQSDMAALKNIEILCDSYDGAMIGGLDKHVLKNVFAFKAPTCKIKIFAPDEMLNTTAYCKEIGGTIQGDECLVLDSGSQAECNQNDDLIEGYQCILSSKCDARDGSLDFKNGDYYCTDSAGITKNGIFNSYDDKCLYSGVAICNLNSFEVEEVVITEYNLKEV